MHYSVVRESKTYLEERRQIVGAILKQSIPLEKETDQLIQDVQKEIERLSK
jgi:hypothetical protein